MSTLREALSYQPEELAFGTSGLRGLLTAMTDLECYLNTAGFIQFLQKSQSLQPGHKVFLAGDLRSSTPRILRAVHKAVIDAGLTSVNCGFIPTPAVAFFAQENQAPCIMVTGSHIPDDRNGIKFYKTDGEVLKADEAGIKAAVAEVRAVLYRQEVSASLFDKAGALKQPMPLPAEDKQAYESYIMRYRAVFDVSTLAGKKVVFYQHSAVGRDMLVELLRQLGAEVVPVGRSEKFIPIDSENVTPDDHAYFKRLAAEHPDAFAIVSTDGDSDRPFVVDERGVFHRGDELGALVAEWLEADATAFPISANDAVNTYLTQKDISITHTKVGSPYVITAMQQALEQGKRRVVGWEVNGGFLLGCDITVGDNTLSALPTRDAIFPIIVALKAAIDQDGAASALFAKLPQRFTSSGLINDFPSEISQKIVALFSTDSQEVRRTLADYFSDREGFGAIQKVNGLDGVRIFFEGGDIAHLRPSGNAPQLRIYSVADTQERANEIVALAIAEPHGIFRRIEKDLK
jgi:phosphomannomutase